MLLIVGGTSWTNECIEFVIKTPQFVNFQYEYEFSIRTCYIYHHACSTTEETFHWEFFWRVRFLIVRKSRRNVAMVTSDG